MPPKHVWRAATWPHGGQRRQPQAPQLTASPASLHPEGVARPPRARHGDGQWPCGVAARILRP
eukprot:8265510-Alexandrium_andersonii.AAC.1